MQLGLSRKELAARAGLTEADVARIEGDDTEGADVAPSSRLSAQLRAALGGTLSSTVDKPGY